MDARINVIPMEAFMNLTKEHIPESLLYEFEQARKRVREAKAEFLEETALRHTLEMAIVHHTGGCHVCQNAHYPPCEPWEEDNV